MTDTEYSITSNSNEEE